MSNRPHELNEPGKLLLLSSLLAKQRIISNNAKAFFKELILRRDPRLASIMTEFESKSSGDALFMQQIHELIEAESSTLFNDLFAETSLEVGKSLSKREREEKNLNDVKNLIYGEVEYKAFYALLRKINPKPGLTFYDLGSGTGKAVFVARLTQDFAKCVGIEILTGLHNAGFKVVEKYNQSFRSILDNNQKQHVVLYKGSFLERDWSDGDVVFANSTCFDDELMHKMQVQAEALKPGSILVTFTKGLTNLDKFELLEKKREKMSWGPATVYIHRRLSPSGESVGPMNLNLLPCDSEEYQEPYEDDSDEDEDADSYDSTSTSDNDDDDDDIEVDYDYLEDESESEDDDLQVPPDARVTPEEAEAMMEQKFRQETIDRYSRYMTGETPDQSGGSAAGSNSERNTAVYKRHQPPSLQKPDPALDEFGSPGRNTNYANMGFSSPQDSGLMARKMAKRNAAQK